MRETLKRWGRRLGISYLVLVAVALVLFLAITTWHSLDIYFHETLPAAQWRARLNSDGPLGDSAELQDNRDTE